MLDGLKSVVRRDKTNDIIMEATGSDVKDIFLDSMDAVVLGAENDPEINRLIAAIPAYEDTDPEFEKKIESITESTIFLTEL